ncbi:MAG: hypothetical protein U5R14_07635 [Gemmatimonadota bacterium]|nr:hypothetical protein [Gemmatimonadota bacterium]
MYRRNVDRGIWSEADGEGALRAHAAGLRVSTHVETAQDFRHALDAAVDEINHLPGFRGDEENRFPSAELFRLTEEDAERAAESGVVVVTTLGSLDEFGDAETVERARETFRWNLSLLNDRGVRLALGSDAYGSVGVDQAMQVLELGVFSNLELLKLWVEETPRAIFPHRKLGRDILESRGSAPDGWR